MLNQMMDLATRFVVAVEKIAANAPASVPAPKATAAKKTTETKTPEKVPEKVAEAKTPEKAPEKPVEDDLMGEAPAAKEVTLEMLKDLVKKSVETVDKAKIKGVIETVGNAPNVTSIDPKNYAACYAAIEALK